MLKRNKKSFWLVALVFMLCPVNLADRGLALAQTSPDWQEKWKKIVAEAKKEGRVVVFGPPGELIRNAVLQGFRKAFPELTIEYSGAPGGEQATKIRAERDGGIYSVDVFLSGVSTITKVLKPLGAFDPVSPLLVLPEVADPKNWRDARFHFGDKEGQFNLIFVGMVSPKLIYHPGQVKREEVDELD